MKLTGINDKMLETAPKFHEIAKRIVEITQNTVLVAHNAQFDYRILRTEFRRLGYNFERKTICTVDLSKKLLPDAESYSLGKLVRSLGIAVSDRHRANGDALATIQLFKVLLNKDIDKQIIINTIRNENQGELSERQIDLVEQIPSETGVYYMHNKDGDIIYLGKSRNLKKRVNKHFIKSGDRARQLQKETKKITFEKTGNELIALLKELEELRRNKPKFNTSSKQKLFSYGLYKSYDQSGFINFKVDRLRGGQNPVTTFNGIQSAKNFLFRLSTEFNLCTKLNGLSDTTSECENYQKSKCNGACLDLEAPTAYNIRAQEALKKYSISGRNIIILDRGREIGEQSAILIKNGVFQGFGYFNLNFQINNISILDSIISPAQGGLNAKYLIENHLRKQKHLKVIEF